MSNIIQRLTNDCKREDCSLYENAPGTATAMGWTPIFDKLGNRADRGDPNIYTSGYRCSACGREWTVSRKYDEVTVTERLDEGKFQS